MNATAIAVLLFAAVLPPKLLGAGEVFNSLSKTYADLYVSTTGNDSWSGKLAEPNPERTDGPLATLGRARQALRALKNCAYRDVYVLIRGGEYRLRETVVFEPEDSHYDSFLAVYMAYPGEVPVFSSDVEIKGWTPVSDFPGLPEKARGHVYQAKLQALANGKIRFYSLYDEGFPLERARSDEFLCNQDIDRNAAKEDLTRFSFPDGKLRNWTNLQDIELFVRPRGYVTNYLTLASVDLPRRVAHTTLPTTYAVGKAHPHLKSLEGLCRIENAIEYLNEPGQWVVNTQAGYVYYWPQAGTPQKVTYPALTEYIRLDGHERGGLIRNVALRGLTFTRGERDLVTKGDTALQHEWDLWNKANALVRLRDAEYCEVAGCRFTHSAGDAVRLDLYAQSNTVRNNLIDYVGGTGILLCGYGPGKLHVNRGNFILSNQIHHCGELSYQASGIMAAHSGENIIRYNKLHNLPYAAIVLSGTRPNFFQRREPQREQVGSFRTMEIDPSALYQAGRKDSSSSDFINYYQWPRSSPYYHTRNNRVEDNDIFLVVQKGFDGNGIYISDVGNGNEIRRNYIHHLNGNGMQQAIRTDMYVKNITIADNVIYNCTGGGINLKYYGHNACNNIIADVRDIVFESAAGTRGRMFIGYISLMQVWPRDRMPAYSGVNIARNIFYKTAAHQTFYREGSIKGKPAELGIEVCNIDYNLYFDAAASDGGASAVQRYRARGADAHSVAGDPLFRDISKGDFRLKEGSPAFQLGFRDIDLSRVGLADDFPFAYRRAVAEQLGEGYDAFESLESKCTPNVEAAGKANLAPSKDF